MAPFTPGASQAGVDLYWLPLGAGGWFVKMNGRIWEAIHALRERRRPLDLYHTALVLRVPDGRFVVENCWPIPNADGPSRGVLVEGPVFSRRLGRWRMFRYEVRCWPDGIIADANAAVASPQLLSDDPVVARRLLELVGSLPSAVLTLDQEAGQLLLGYERDLEPRLADDSGDLAHLAGWAAKLAGATCRLAALLHLADHLRDGWACPIGVDTLASALRLADYLIEHARAVFDLMGSDPRIDDARWLLDWISRTNRTQFSRRDAHAAAPAAGSPRPPTSSPQAPGGARLSAPGRP